MAFTTISRIILDAGDGGPEGHFYAPDIAVVLNQVHPVTGVQAFSTQMFNATNVSGSTQFKVLVGVTALNGDGTAAQAGLLTNADNWVAISCPPHNKTGFEGKP